MKKDVSGNHGSANARLIDEWAEQDFSKGLRRS